MRPVVLAMFLAACGADAAREDTTSAAAPSPVNAPVAASADSLCPANGLWAACAVVTRLERAGLVPRVDSAPVTEPPLSPAGTLVRLGNAELELFFFPDAAAADRAVMTLDSTQYVAYQTPVPVRRLPTLIRSANLIAVFHSRNDHQRERVGDALTAGPPQPSTPRP